MVNCYLGGSDKGRCPLRRKTENDGEKTTKRETKEKRDERKEREEELSTNLDFVFGAASAAPCDA